MVVRFFFRCGCRRLGWRWGWLLSGGWLAAAEGPPDHLIDFEAEPPLYQSADWAEPVPIAPSPERVTRGFGPVAPAARQPQGALSGRIVYMNAGHGWVYAPDYWRLQRPAPLHDMNEDYGNLDQLNFFAAYCFNAGAIVVPFRPLGQQTNEVVIDNPSSRVTWTGTWADSTSTIYYGAAGAVPYRYAALAATETATATYTPAIPETGYYPVYTWVRHGSDRGHQLYRIRHTGGESEVRIPHHMVGSGWVYLGEYYFNAGADSERGAVVISNLRGSAAGSYVFADAIRFGNGMGTVARDGLISTYPREDEGTRYWIQNSLGQGQSASLYDGSGNDESDGWSAPPKMSREMNREAAGGFFDRIHINFHSNAGGGRGAIGLITGSPTPNQAALAALCGQEVNTDLRALGSPPLETPWSTRTTYTYTGGYSEIDTRLFGDEMDATIIEVAFHDSAEDARILRDPKGRAAIGKAAMHAVVKHMNRFDGGPLAFLPEPPANPRALGAANGDITLRWTMPVATGGSGAPTGYVIYRSTDGYGFGQPVEVGNVTTYTFTDLPADTAHYFRIAARNAGGESLPSVVVGCRAPVRDGAPKILVVNAFETFTREGNPRQNVVRRGYAAPSGTGSIERVWPRRNNAFDYVVSHGQAISAFQFPFDSCQHTAVGSGAVLLAEYQIVVWAAGRQSAEDGTFATAEQNRLTAFRAGSGHLFASGSDIAWDLGRAAGPSAADRAFLSDQLQATLANDAAGNSAQFTVRPAAGGIFAARAGTATIDNGSGGIYRAGTPDVLTPAGEGVSRALIYGSVTTRGAAVQYDGAAGGGRVVYFGFPFETLTDASLRRDYMADILTFFTADDFLIPAGSAWRYLDTGTAPAAEWKTAAFDDTTWAEGRARFGYGGDGEATTVQGGSADSRHPVTWFRHTFTVADAEAVAALRLDFQRDDGVVLFLNGVEIARDNLPTGPVSSSQWATAAIGGEDETAWVTRFVPALTLQDGLNVLAAQVHQAATTSSDLGFDLRLAALPVAALTFADWQHARFGDAANDPTIAGPLADPDGDGVPNLLEYATGADPQAASAPFEPLLSFDEEGAALRFGRVAALADLTLTLQASDDLETWTDLARASAGAPFAALHEGHIVTETGAGAWREVRLREVRPGGEAEPSRRYYRCLVVRE